MNDYLERRYIRGFIGGFIVVGGCLAGCNTWEKLDNTEKGAVIGGGSGALIGNAVSPGVGGTVIGGALGAGAGGLIGREEDRNREYDERKRRRR